MVSVDPLVARTATRAVTRALGWGVRRIKAVRDDKKMLQLIADSWSQDASTRAQNLSEPDSNRLGAFLGSPEVERVAFALASQRMLAACGGKKLDERVADIRAEFMHNLFLAVDRQDPALWEGVGREVFDRIDAGVAICVVEFAGGGGDIPASTRAGLVKAAAGMAAASIRNTTLLETLESLEGYRDFEQTYRTQVRGLHGTMRLPHAGTSRRVPYERLFVAPTVRPLASEHDDPEDPRTPHNPLEGLPLADVLATSMRLVMLGDPGGGKSTSSLKIAYDTAVKGINEGGATVPFLVTLRDYVEQYVSNRMSILNWITRTCETPYAVTPPDGCIEYLLLNGRAVVIFDGLDELLDTSLRREVVEAVEGFAYLYPLTPMLVTSRRIGYDEALLDPDLFDAVQLQKFSPDQVEAYVRKWFSLDDGIEHSRKTQIAEAFLSDSEFVHDLRVNPLMLSLMCGIYATENYIPRNRPEVYEKCALLLFDRWDRQRGIRQPLSFDAHVQDAMRSLALWLYPRQEAQNGLPRSALIDYMKDYLLRKRFDDELEAEQAATEFIDFCKGRAWVLSDIGSELYGFTHRTFLEYFAASQMVRLHPGASALLGQLWQHITRYEWDVVAQLSLQILGKTVDDGADSFLELLVERAKTAGDSAQEAAALSFAARALAFIVPRPSVLRAIADAVVDYHCRGGRSSGVTGRAQPISHLLAATPENLPLVARYYREALVRRLSTESCDERALLLALHPTSATSGIRAARIDRAMWDSFAVENRGVFAPYVDACKSQYSWVAARVIEEGRMTCAELVATFGVRGLYDYDQAGYTIDPPIAYKILNINDLVGTRWTVSASLVTQLYEVLVTEPTPWLWNDHHYLDITFLQGLEQPSRGVRIADDTFRSVVALLAMPVFELEMRARRRGGGGRRSRYELLELLPPARAAEGHGVREVVRPQEVNPRRSRRSRALSLLELRPEVARMVDEWLNDSISFVRPDSSGRLTSTR